MGFLLFAMFFLTSGHILTFFYCLVRNLLLRSFYSVRHSKKDPFVAQTEAAIFDLTNDHRVKHGLPLVTRHSKLDASSLYHAKRMIATGEFEHTLSDGVDLGQRVQAACYIFQTVRENLAWHDDYIGATPNSLARDIVNGWINSPGHQANLVADDVTQIGISVRRTFSRVYAVQNFGKPMVSIPALLRPAKRTSFAKQTSSSKRPGRFV
ncbi:MAG: CAP domain-containing protein [Planctomycetales bacterium]|nr:CAP domain-containing protein [Planctomycetales bacterium]